MLLVGAWLACTHVQADSKASVPGDTMADEEVIFDSDPKTWARVKHIVPPKYPQDALERGIEGIVDVEVLIDVVGYAKEIRAISSTPRNPAFEEATLEVVRRWVFNVPISSKCVPYETVGSARLTFTVANGKAQIALSHRALPDKNPPPVAKYSYGWLSKPEDRTRVRYPAEARRAGAQANLNFLATVSGTSGEVLEVEITHILAAKPFKPAFSFAVINALKGSHVSPLPDPLRPNFKFCGSFLFRLTDN